MGADVRAMAIRFADLWAVDPHQMVDEIYADDIVMENMANPARLIVGSDQLHAVEVELAARIPQHRHELIRVIVDGDVACLETTIVAPVTHEYAPACVWWWLDQAGNVAAEVGWFDWADRSTDSMRSHGTVPPSRRSTDDHDPSWYQTMAHTYAGGWSDDATGAALRQFSDRCTFGHVGRAEGSGLDELRQARLLELDELPQADRFMHVHRVVGEGAALAMLIAVGDTIRSTRGTIVLTFDSNDLVVSERRYWDFRKALPRDDRTLRTAVGGADWTLRGR
jgi:hypothetical protein